MTDEGSEEPAADEDPFDESDEDPFDDIDGVELDDDPFTDLEVGSDAPTAEPDPSDDTLFTDEEVAELDEDAVWERIEGDSDEADTTADPGTERDRTRPEDEVGETVVEKRSYCERCEYFSDPPEVSCTYPGSEIVELVDTERFRVRNCPIVARRRSQDISAIAGGGATDPELTADGAEAADDSEDAAGSDADD